LEDKTIVITGSGSGLGRECALLFAGESLVQTAVDAFGRLKVMHVNAGILEPGFGAATFDSLSL